MKSLFYLSFVVFQLLAVFAAPISKRTYVPSDMINYRIWFQKPENWGEVVYSYVYTEEESLKTLSEIEEWPGRELERVHETNGYHIAYPQSLLGHSKIIFTDGQNQAPAVLQDGFDLVKEAVYTVDGIVGIMEDYGDNYELIYRNYANIYFHPAVDRTGGRFYDNVKVYLHYSLDNGEWKDVQLQRNPYTNFYTVKVDMGNAQEITFALNNGNNKWDNNNGQNYNFKKFENIYIKSDVEF